MSSPKIDEVIKETLENSANEIEFGADLFPRMKAQLLTPGYYSGVSFHFSLLTTGKKILLTTGAIVVILLASGLFFKDFRVMAAEVIHAVKTIFVAEGTADGYQLIEKSVEEPFLNPTITSTTFLSDVEISQIVRYQVSFPESLYGNFRLALKSLMIALGKSVSYIQAKGLESQMFKAFTDDEELAKLRKFEVERGVSAEYRNENKVPIIVEIWRNHDTYPILVKKVVPIGTARGQWEEYLLPDYSYDDHGGYDMSQKPTRVRIAHRLSWEGGGLCHLLYSYPPDELSLAESLKVAESFMTGQE